MQTTHPNPSLRLNIIGTGKGLPSRLVPSTEIDALLGIKEGRTEKLSGLTQRYFLAEGESADAMQLKAAQNALMTAGITIDDVDCIINASGIDRQCIPFNAAHTLRLLNPARPIAAFDVNMTCLSFLRLRFGGFSVTQISHHFIDQLRRRLRRFGLERFSQFDHFRRWRGGGSHQVV